MSPTLSRAEMNAADDIIAEPAIIPVRRRDLNIPMYGSSASACEGKRSFDSHSLAQSAAKRRSGRSAYRCKFCRKWHVGGNNK